MTAPQPGQPLPIQQQSWAHDAALHAIETATAALILASVMGRLRGLLHDSTRAWVTLFGSVAGKPASADQARPVVELAHAVLDDAGADVPERVDRAMVDGVRAAYVL